MACEPSTRLAPRRLLGFNSSRWRCGRRADPAPLFGVVAGALVAIENRRL